MTLGALALQRHAFFGFYLVRQRAARHFLDQFIAAWRAQPLLEDALRASRESCEGRVLLVTGEEPFADLAARYADRVVSNPRFEDGIGTSIAAAAAACDSETDALIVVLGDQPLVTAAHLRALMTTWDGEEGGIVATSYADTRGPPVLFCSAYFSELAELHDDSGAKRI